MQGISLLNKLPTRVGKQLAQTYDVVFNDSTSKSPFRSQMPVNGVVLMAPLFKELNVMILEMLRPLKVLISVALSHKTSAIVA